MRAHVRYSTPRPRAVALILAAAAFLPSSVQAVPSAAREWNEQLMHAIRLNVPNPPAHARNLFHTAVAMYNAWAAYDSTAVGYIYNEKITSLPASVENARREAISYAAYRILKTRFAQGTFPAGFPQAKIDAVHASFNNKFTSMGYDKVNALAATTAGANPAELGKRIGQAVLTWGAGDAFSPAPPYGVAQNPNMQTTPVNLSLSVLAYLLIRFL